jgi:hypothetical protein
MPAVNEINEAGKYMVQRTTLREIQTSVENLTIIGEFFCRRHSWSGLTYDD